MPVVIPGGYTSKLKPLDVSLNKPFKSYVRQYWSDYIIEQSSQLDSSKKIKPPQKQDVTHWVSDGIQKLQEKTDMIEKSFDVCGITSHRSDQFCPDELIDGQCFPESEDELDEPFCDESLLDDTDVI